MKDRPKANQMRLLKIFIFINFLIQVGMISTAFSFTPIIISPTNIVNTPTSTFSRINNYDRLSKRRKQSKQRIINSLLILKQKNRSDEEKEEEEEIPTTASEVRGKSNNSSNNKNSKNKKNRSTSKDKDKDNTGTSIQNQNNDNNSNNSNSKKSQNKSKSSSNNKKKNSNNSNKKKNNNLINLLANPYEAGVQLRQTIDRTLNLNIKKPLTSEQKSIYYLDDRFLDSGATSRSGGSSSDSMSLSGRNSIPSEGALGFLERKKNSFNDLLDNYDYSIYEDDDYIPEVLVIGKFNYCFELIIISMRLVSMYLNLSFFSLYTYFRSN